MSSRSGAPTGPSRSAINCGYQLTWPGAGDRMWERSAMIGLFMEPGAIKEDQWNGKSAPNWATTFLQKTIRR
jgi:hypothetical protein